MLSQFRILLVDDDPQDRGLVVRELRKAYPDLEIAEAIDMAQLEEQISLGGFDAVITDYHLRWSDGIHVLRIVKQRIPSCPVIMFTGTGNEEIAVEAMKLGLDDYIIKNVKHLVRLRGAVTAAIENAKTKQRAERLASRLDSLLSHLHVGVFTCSIEGLFLELNDAMISLLSQESSADAPQSNLASLFKEDDSWQDFLDRVIKSKSGEPQETELEIETESSVRCLRLNARLISTDPEQQRIDGIIEDVTSRKRTEANAREEAVAVARLSMLSPREQDVLRQIVDGNAIKVTARNLEISDKTVEKHRANLMKKLGARGVADVVRLAMLAEFSKR